MPELTSAGGEDPPLPAGVATGIGSWPGTDPREAMARVSDLLPDLPHVPELPGRGPWAEMTGRAGALLVDLPVELDGARWRTTASAGADLRRARSLLAEDLDAVEQHLQGYQGPAKLQVAGPLTISSTVELRGGPAAIADEVARRDIAVSLGEGLLGHLTDLRQRVPGADWIVQIDEPTLEVVTSGRVPRPSGWGTYAPLPAGDAAALLSLSLANVRAMGARTVVHCCASSPDWDVLSACGADAWSIDVGAVPIASSAPALEPWLDGGGRLWCGIEATDVEVAHGRLRELRDAIGQSAEKFAATVVVTPPCGVAAGLDVATAAYAGAKAVVVRVEDDAHGS